MRQWFFVLVLLVTSVYAQAPKSGMSEMRIVGMAEYHPEELIDYDVKDANGDVAAGLIIETDLVGLAYDANLGMVKMNHSPGRDFLFLQYKEREVKILLSGYAPLQVILKKYGISLEKGRSWLIKLTADKKSELISTVISTTPPGATVFIDGENKGQIKTTTLKDGEHDLRIELEGYVPISAKIAVSLNNALFEYKLEEKQPVPVTINSTPAGAKIYIDNAEKGLTNYSLFLFPGEYDLKLSFAGYLDTAAKIKVTEKGENSFSTNLIKNEGTLILVLEPKTAVVEINKKMQNKTDELGLAPGDYQLTVSKDGYYPVTELIKIKRNEQTKRSISLKEITGNLQLSISPSDADVELLKGTYRNNWKGAKLLKGISIGSYALTAKKVGYLANTVTIKIEENKTAEVNEILKLIEVADAKVNANPTTVTGVETVVDAGATGEQLARQQHPELFKPRDEFESSAEYNARTVQARELTEKFDKNISDNAARAKQAKIEASTKELNGYYIENIGAYNPDNETFPLQIKGQKGTITVPKASARNFKESYASATVKGHSKLNSTLTREVLSLVTVIDPNTSAVYDFKQFLGNMVFVEGGTFRMGNDDEGSDERPIHSVTIGDFYIGKYEVTQIEWQTIMGVNPSKFVGLSRPVENISWNGIQEFLEKLNARTGKHYRLPTEAEWEYAARGGSHGQNYKFSGSNDVDDVAWYYDNSDDETHEVGLKKPNELGLYDMCGNVWEWCQDLHDENYYSNSPIENPQGASLGNHRILRGGSWFGEDDNKCRSTFRGWNTPDISSSNYGFRLAITN